MTDDTMKQATAALFGHPEPEPQEEAPDLTQGNVAPNEGTTKGDHHPADQSIKEFTANLFGRDFWG